ncbi:intercompartmental signaling factor BofC [Bacillus aquiflavi]|uniref:Intercompartmental signaling factor BofC n=1 Tax=Bacillus aquiflavi TaxID=2672567 RepID=A0A6B3W0E4_9BACI|nr:intercompartmental signaling factor BofC [Bacillus aquiflavi]MBA4537175.1 intercompartmental signaling factor BofC [Bacillus aquiflavi]NEY81433.1 regulator [Bacillus aquiflavi]
MRSRWTMLTILKMIVSVIFVCVMIIMNQKQVIADSDLHVSDPLKLSIILERVYLDGEMSEEEIVETIWSLEDFWAKYDEWNLIDLQEGKAVFQQQVDDISPFLKENGFFGITEEGIFTIFNGKPEDANVIQSFFQIDVKKLESQLHDQLKKGIPIRTKDKYFEVIEAFQHYSLLEKQKN